MPQQLYPSPHLRIPFAVMDLPPSVLHLPSPLPQGADPGHSSHVLSSEGSKIAQHRAAAAHTSQPHLSHSSAAGLTGTEQPGCSRSGPILSCSTFSLLPAPRGHCGGERPILYLTTATMKSSGPMTRTWLAAVPLSGGE